MLNQIESSELKEEFISKRSIMILSLCEDKVKTSSITYYVCNFLFL